MCVAVLEASRVSRGIGIVCRRGPLGRPGDDPLSHRWDGSTLGAAGFHGRVRNGIGWGPRAVVTRSTERPGGLKEPRVLGRIETKVVKHEAWDMAIHPPAVGWGRAVGSAFLVATRSKRHALGAERERACSSD